MVSQSATLYILCPILFTSIQLCTYHILPPTEVRVPIPITGKLADSANTPRVASPSLLSTQIIMIVHSDNC